MKKINFANFQLFTLMQKDGKGTVCSCELRVSEKWGPGPGTAEWLKGTENGRGEAERNKSFLLQNQSGNVLSTAEMKIGESSQQEKAGQGSNAEKAQQPSVCLRRRSSHITQP